MFSGLRLMHLWGAVRARQHWLAWKIAVWHLGLLSALEGMAE